MPETASNASIAYGNNSLLYPLAVGTSLGGWLTTSDRKPTRAGFSLTSAVNQEVLEILISDWPAKNDSFTQANLLDTEEDQIKELIFRIRTTLSIPYRESLATRLVTLFGDAKEEDVDSVGIALDSLQSFYNFFRINNNLKCPIISLTPDNTIYASWKGEQNRVFSVHFLSNRDVRFVIFKPNNRHPEKQIRISGTATTDTLMETLRSICLDWITE
jgi:hypothetical protein